MTSNHLLLPACNNYIRLCPMYMQAIQEHRIDLIRQLASCNGSAMSCAGARFKGMTVPRTQGLQRVLDVSAEHCTMRTALHAC